MKKTILLLSMLLVSMNIYSQISIKIKEFSIASNTQDTIFFNAVSGSDTPRIKLKVEIQNQGSEIFRFNGSGYYDQFYADFYFGKIKYEGVRCTINSADIPYQGGEEKWLDLPPSDLCYVEIEPCASYNVTLYIYDEFSTYNYKAKFMKFIYSVKLEYQRRETENGEVKTYYSAPLKPGEYKIVEE
jgi:hypothetical protein